MEQEIRDIINNKTKRVAIFAFFNEKGIVLDTVIYYLTELKKSFDSIIFVADCDIKEKELHKIKKITPFYRAKRHKMYDFGSYKIGYEIGLKNNLIDNNTDLLLCNDSCFGPVFDLAPIIKSMNERDCDFWGMISNTDVRFHLQSWFIYFKNKVIKSQKLYNFLSDVKEEKDFWSVVFNYEMRLTDFLIKSGFKADSYLPQDVPELESVKDMNGNCNGMICISKVLDKYKFPFMKIKNFSDGYSETAIIDSPDELLYLLKRSNKELYKLVLKSLKIMEFKKDDNNVYTKIDKSTVVSFDVFDTLLVRPFLVPTDLFLFIELKFGYKGFADARIGAESKARKKYKLYEDITLDEIYESIDSKFKDLKKLEIKWELRLLKTHKENFKLYQYALKKKKKIVVVSDMYLSKDTLVKALKQNGYNDISKVYVSNEYRASKGTGNLFKKVITDFKVEPNKILHIGDNEEADFSVPISLGMNAHKTDKYIDRFLKAEGNAKFYNFYKMNSVFIDTSILTGMFAYKQQFNYSSYWEFLGYCFGGPLALSYVNLIRKETKLYGNDTILFVARDGYILQKVYNLIEKNPLPNFYVYAPRIMVFKCFDITKIDEVYYKSYNALLHKTFPKKIPMYEDNKAFFAKLKKEKETISKWTNNNYKNYKKYLDSLGIKGKKIVSVDMTTGMFSSEKFLQDMFGSNYSYGFFSFTFLNNPKLKYILFSDKVIGQWFYNEAILTELLITAPTCSIEDIVDNKPIFSKANKFEKARIDVIKEIQEGILNFVKDHEKLFGSDNNTFSSETIISLLKHYVHTPSAYDALYLKKVCHNDSGVENKYISLYEWFEVEKYLPNDSTTSLHFRFRSWLDRRIIYSALRRFALFILPKRVISFIRNVKHDLFRAIKNLLFKIKKSKKQRAYKRMNKNANKKDIEEIN